MILVKLIKGVLSLTTFNNKYNNLRYHQSLGYKTPMQYLQNLQEKKGDKLYVM